jgi:hypothetical protein
MVRRPLFTVGLAGGVAALGCREPTQVTVELFTDVDCATVEKNEVAISIGVLGPALEETSDFVASTPKCGRAGPDHRIGSLVIVPRDEKDAEFGLRALLRVEGNGQTASCAAPDYRGCVVARRAVSFLPHTELRLPIVLRYDCKDEPCGPYETCVRGTCRPAIVTDASLCATVAGCGEDTLDPGEGGGGAGGEGGAGSGGEGGAGGGGGAGGEAPAGPLDTLMIPVDGTPVFSQSPLAVGKSYLLRASGVFTTNPGSMWEADAEYYDFANPTDNVNVADVGVAIDDPVSDFNRTQKWGPYNPAHLYELIYVGTGNPLRLQYHDGTWTNNQPGTLKVEIFNAP